MRTIQVAPAAGRLLPCSSRPVLAPARSQPLPRLAHTEPEPLYYPRKEEEEGVLHQAFLTAMTAAKPSSLRVPGLQEFAAALWQRRKIPSAGGDALLHLFNEYDLDNDGLLSAAELAQVFASNGVSLTTQQVQDMIVAFEGGATDDEGEPQMHRDKWPDFVYSLAVSDLHARSTSSMSSQDSP